MAVPGEEHPLVGALLKMCPAAFSQFSSSGEDSTAILEMLKQCVEIAPPLRSVLHR